MPAIGSSAGGTRVTISGAYLSLPPNFACALPCPTRVTFGGAQAQLLGETNTELIVTTPAHAAGAVPVTITTGDGRTATAPDAFLYTDELESSFERILLPVYLEAAVPGSNGSSWQTQLWLRDNSDKDGVTLAPWVCPKGALCPPVVPLTRTLQPQETLSNLPELPQTNIARLLYVNRDGMPSLSMGLRLYEKSRADVDAGTEIAIVRERDLLVTAAHLHDVPLNQRFRINIRVYELGLDVARFRVRVFEEAAGISTRGPIEEIELVAKSQETGAFRTRPAIAEYNELTQLLSLPTVFPLSVRIEVEPLSTGSRFWAFASITNNETQRVTLVTPQ